MSARQILLHPAPHLSLVALGLARILIDPTNVTPIVNVGIIALSITAIAIVFSGPALLGSSAAEKFPLVLPIAAGAALGLFATWAFGVAGALVAGLATLAAGGPLIARSLTPAQSRISWPTLVLVAIAVGGVVAFLGLARGFI